MQTKSQLTGHSYYKTTGGTGKKIAGDTWSISYGDGSGAAGVVYADKVAIGKYMQLLLETLADLTPQVLSLPLRRLLKLLLPSHPHSSRIPTMMDLLDSLLAASTPCPLARSLLSLTPSRAPLPRNCLLQI